MVLAIDGLHAGGAVHVGAGPDLGASRAQQFGQVAFGQVALGFGCRPGGPTTCCHLCGDHHVGQRAGEFEPLGRPFGEHRRSERPESFALFHLVVEVLDHRRIARIGEDRSVAEGPRTELHPPLEPTHHRAAVEGLGNDRRELLVGRVFGERDLVVGEPLDDRLVFERRPEHAARHGVAASSGRTGSPTHLVPRPHRGADRSAIVACCGLHPDLLERPVAQDPLVGHAVQRDAACEAGRGLPRQLVGPPGHGEHHLLEHHLGGAGDVGLTPTERLAGRPGRAVEQVGQSTRRHAFAAPVGEVARVEAYRAVLVEVHDPFEQCLSEPRLAERGESHEFVLAVVDLETTVGGHRRIEQAQRVGEVELLEQLDAVRGAVPDARGGPFADTVEGEHRSPFERRRMERRCRVALVVLGEHQLGHGVTELGEAAFDPVGHPELRPRPQRDRLGERTDAGRSGAGVGGENALVGGERLGVERHRREVAGAHAGILETPRDGVERKVRVVLVAGEALLGRGGHEHSVHEQRGGGIVVVATDAENHSLR